MNTLIPADHISGIADLKKNSESGEKVGVLYNGTDIKVVEKKGNFYRVIVEGWVPISTVATMGTVASPVSPQNSKLIDINKIKVLNVVGIEDGTGGMVIEGSVRNELGRSVKNIKLVAEYYDPYDNLIKKDYIYVRYEQSGLYPDQQVKFSFPRVFDRNAVKYAVIVEDFDYDN